MLSVNQEYDLHTYRHWFPKNLSKWDQAPKGSSNFQWCESLFLRWRYHYVHTRVLNSVNVYLCHPNPHIGWCWLPKIKPWAERLANFGNPIGESICLSMHIAFMHTHTYLAMVYPQGEPRSCTQLWIQNLTWRCWLLSRFYLHSQSNGWRDKWAWTQWTRDPDGCSWTKVRWTP